MRNNARSTIRPVYDAKAEPALLAGTRIFSPNCSIQLETFANKDDMVMKRYLNLTTAEGNSMAQNSSSRIDESALTKGQRRKLNALRKSVGDEVGERAFAEWLATRPVAKSDENATLIVDTLWPLVQQGKLAIPRGGYLLRRGRGRIIVEPAKQ